MSSEVPGLLRPSPARLVCSACPALPRSRLAVSGRLNLLSLSLGRTSPIAFQQPHMHGSGAAGSDGGSPGRRGRGAQRMPLVDLWGGSHPISRQCAVGRWRHQGYIKMGAEPHLFKREAGFCEHKKILKSPRTVSKNVCGLSLSLDLYIIHKQTNKQTRCRT